MKKISIRFSIGTWLAVTILLAWILPACNKPSEQPGKTKGVAVATPPPLTTNATPAAESTTGPLDLRTAIIQVAQKNIPAVVHIEVTERQTIPNPFSPFNNDPFFRFFFPDVPREQKRELKGIGTGIILDTKGHILTNNHVAGGATKIQVLIADGRTYPGKLVGADPKTDLAVIQIEAKEPLPYVTFADSDKVQVGEWVVAIGHPRGLDQTVTQGIISAKHRTGITDPNSYQDFLQTDAAINPGNSGGPLLTLTGKVIGINSAIISESGGYEGIGFAIPGNMALHVANSLIARGKVERGWLGVSAQDLTPDLAQSFGLGSPKGALVAEVTKDGPADKAGIKRGDVVLAYKAKEIPDASTLRNEVANTPSGEPVKVILWRDKERKEITVTMGNLESVAKVERSSLKKRLGGEFRAVRSEDVEKYNLESQTGVVITSVDPKGALAEAGFEVDDIILSINRAPIDDPSTFAELISKVPPRQKLGVLILDHRTGNATYAPLVVR
ncbi:MAG: Do family serine endopeptidase [Thermodesulfobacteriota bacterium]|jgi:serine protease Do|nr:MAG: Do family serine endopeptidase [Thermodesulfobacteriota bacterium]